MILIVSGIFAKTENACQKDYYFAADIRTTPTVTGTPDDGDDDDTDDDLTPIGSPTARTPTVTATETPEVIISGTPSPTPVVTAGAREPLARSAKDIFTEVEKSTNAKKVEEKVRSSINLKSDGNSNWLGQQYKDSEGKGDSDKDGFTDELEDAQQTDPKDPKSFPKSIKTKLSDILRLDKDGDGLIQEDEIALEISPSVPDTDDDGCGDGSEVLSFSDPKNSQSFPSPDSDRDCLTDEFETKWELRADRADTDQDGLSDAKEVALGTNPFSKDTDSDGILDGKEISINSNPLVADY